MEKPYKVIMVTHYNDTIFINTNQALDSTYALGLLAKASHYIADSNATTIRPKDATFPVFITVDEDKAKMLAEMTSEEWYNYQENRDIEQDRE
jgi:hypothetical protein